MSDDVLRGEVAVKPEQWRGDGESGRPGRAGGDDEGLATQVVIRRANGASVEAYGRKALRSRMAVANDALPHDDPQKLTWTWVADLQMAARELRILERALHPESNPEQCLSARVTRYAAAVEAMLRGKL